MTRRPPRSTRTDTLFPYTTLFRSALEHVGAVDPGGGDANQHLVRAGARRGPFDGHQYLRSAPLLGVDRDHRIGQHGHDIGSPRSEEHTSELQSLMRISYAVFCLKKKNNTTLGRQNTYIDQAE